MTEQRLPPGRVLCLGCTGGGIAPRLTPPHRIAACPLCRGAGHVSTNTPPVDPRSGRQVAAVYPR